MNDLCTNGTAGDTDDNTFPKTLFDYDARAFRQQQPTLMPTPANNGSKRKEKRARKIEVADNIGDPRLSFLFLSVKLWERPCDNGDDAIDNYNRYGGY